MSPEEVFAELHQGLPDDDPARLEYTRWAFEALPRLQRRRILDVGCGRGGPTLELARLAEGMVVGLDTDSAALAALARRLAERRLTHRVRLVRGSMRAMPFGDEVFDAVWAEGSVWVVGFEAALDDWRRFIVPGGFLVVHEMAWLRPEPPREIADHWRRIYPGIRTVPEYSAAVARHGYELVASRTLPKDLWWHAYYGPLESRIRELRPRCRDDPEASRALDREHEEVELYAKYLRWYGSAILIMRKPGRGPESCRNGGGPDQGPPVGQGG
jgi:SAM-dependent methyltransferase